MIYKIGLRNIFRDKKRTYTLGATFAFVALLLVTLFSFINGFEKNLRTTLAQSITGHVTFYGVEKYKDKDLNLIRNYKVIKDEIKKEMSDITVYNRTSTNLRVYYNGYSKNYNILGIQPEIEKNYKKSIDIIEGSWQDFLNQKNGILMTEKQANYFEVNLGDEIVASLKTIYGSYNTASFKVSAIYKSSNFISGQSFVGHHDHLAKALFIPEGATQDFNFYFKSSRNLNEKKDKIIDIISELYPNVKIEYLSEKDVEDGVQIFELMSNMEYKDHAFIIATIDEILAPLKDLTKIVNIIGYSIATILLLIISVALYVNIRMTINDRMKEIGTMRTSGMQKSTLISLMIVENSFLAFVFSIVGTIFSFLIMILFQFISLSKFENLGPLLNQGHLVFSINPLQIFMAIGFITVFTIIFSFIPSYQAGKVDPVEALRK